MEYALYIVVFTALALFIFMIWINKPIKRTSRRYSIRVFEEGRDPIKDRFEIHLRK